MIDSYKFGAMTIQGKTYKNDLFVMEKNVWSDWWRKKGHLLQKEDIEDRVKETRPEVVVIGTGKFGVMKIAEETEKYLEERQGDYYIRKTGAAVELYNDLTEKDSKVLGCFHLTC